MLLEMRLKSFKPKDGAAQTAVAVAQLNCNHQGVPNLRHILAAVGVPECCSDRVTLFMDPDDYSCEVAHIVSACQWASLSHRLMVRQHIRNHLAILRLSFNLLFWIGTLKEKERKLQTFRWQWKPNSRRDIMEYRDPFLVRRAWNLPRNHHLRNYRPELVAFAPIRPTMTDAV